MLLWSSIVYALYYAFCYQKIDGGEHGKEKDFDFLSSIEVSSFDLIIYSPPHY